MPRLTHREKAAARLLINPRLAPARRELVVASFIRSSSVPRYVHIRRLARRYQSRKENTRC